MNITFFGTSNRSIPILNALKESQFDLVLCVTKEDVTVGRKKILKPTEVKRWAEQNGVQCLTINSMDLKTTQQITDALSESKIELGVVADFSFMIPGEIFDFPEHKFVNVHFSLLPKYRGASPIQFAILNQDEKTGISYQVLIKALDEGPIIHQTHYKLDSSETTETLRKILFELSAKELPKILDEYVKKEIKPKGQNHSKATYTYSPSHLKSTKIFKEDAKIDWKQSPKEIDALVRAFNPWPIAWTTLNEFENLKDEKKAKLKAKIYDTNIKNGELIIKKIQVEGKKIIEWKEFENGYLTSGEAVSST